jgi:hypothetical protein
MGIRSGTVNAHRDRGLRKLRERLEPIVAAMAFIGALVGVGAAFGALMLRALDGDVRNLDPSSLQDLMTAFTDEPLVWTHLFITLLGMALGARTIRKNRGQPRD